MVQTTKTLNPLPFHSLEPKRFEDLIRGLIYDFRKWRQLEATGRSGGDEGFDIRGWEIIETEETVEESEEADDLILPYTTDRLWLIQGKREKSISPQKMESYLDEIFKENKGKLHGVIFAAACDFSIKTRNLFRARMIKEGMQEFQLWSGAELENMLFQSKNDNLLFAFFGISLTIRRKNLESTIKRVITIKAKTIKTLGGFEFRGFKQLLLRDPEDTAYPYKDEIKNKKRPGWIVGEFLRHQHDGILVVVKKHEAYIYDDGKHWDYEDSVNQINLINDPWNDDEELTKKRSQLYEFLKDVPEKNRVHLVIIGLIPYEKIIAIDPNGDPTTQVPHIYAPFDNDGHPFVGFLGRLERFTSWGREVITDNPSKKDVKKFFPDKYPDILDRSVNPLAEEVTIPEDNPTITSEKKPSNQQE